MVRWLLLSLGIGGLTTCLIVGCALFYSEPSRKYGPADVNQTPAELPAAADPEAQIESHTCGLHAVRAVYTAYGLEPDDHDLRFRLGTDRKANIFDKSSSGTLQPDILRVLRQDGFAAEPAELEQELQSLQEHLESGHLVLALIHPGSYHWVVLLLDSEQQLWVVDSVKDDPYPMGWETLLREELLSAILVLPSTNHDTSISDAHKDGLKDMRQTLKRKKLLGANQR